MRKRTPEALSHQYRAPSKRQLTATLANTLAPRLASDMNSSAVEFAFAELAGQFNIDPDELFQQAREIAEMDGYEFAQFQWEFGLS